MYNRITAEQYDAKKQQIARQAKTLRQAGKQLALRKKTSNLFRNRDFAHEGIDVTHMNHVISVDTDKMLIEAEGMTTFETLVEEALKHNCLPAVVPELKSITIGGGFTGVAIESSSFRYGLVHETIEEADILLGNGEVVTATRTNKYKDLFFGFPNTYGALGYALRLKMKLIPIKRFVKLTHVHFNDPKLYFKALEQSCEQNRNKGNIAYIDGVIFSQNDLHLTLAEFVDEAPFVSDYKYMDIFFESIKDQDEDYLTAKDYIWRWDTDWFWCSKNFGMHNRILRFIFGKLLLKSTRYWKLMHFARNNKIYRLFSEMWGQPKETIIQDIEVPINHAERFHYFFQKEIGIKPVWICPVQTANPKAQFPFYDLKPDTLFVNFGFWDNIPSTQPAGHYNKMIEQEVHACKGHKSLYSDVYYDEDFFWKLYDKNHYTALKAKYDSEGGLKDWFRKVVGR